MSHEFWRTWQAAYRINGDIVNAVEAADEAIAVASERHARILECLARIVRADLLMRLEEDHQDAAKQDLARGALY